MSPSTKPGSRSPMSKWRLLRSSPPSSTAIGTTRSSPAKVYYFIVSPLLTSRGTLLDPLVELYRDNGGAPLLVAVDDDSGPFSSADALLFRFAVGATDTYFLKAQAFPDALSLAQLGTY